MAPVIRRLSLPLVAVGLAFGVLATARPATASPKTCAAVARKAKAQLAKSLVACGRRDLTTEIGRCGADRWRQYVDRLAQRGCEATPTRSKRIRRPVVSRIQAAFSPDDLAAADVEARDAHLALRRLLERVLPTAAAARRGGPAAIATLQALAQKLQDAVARVDEAEATLAAVEDGIWHGFAGDPSLSWLIDEPLRSAMQQMQVEVRRLIGPEWPTEIEALRDQPGCSGDLIGDRMIAAYGDAVLAGGQDRSGEAAALGRIAGQLACLSIRQTALVDVAVSVAADRVERLLDEAGLARIQGDFARILAPVQVLVLDTVKIAGDHAYAWHWFVTRYDRLHDAIARLGWATSDVVWLYDRIDGRMIGFPPCESGDAVGRCVDVGAFLDSLVDPRALGLGDCALSGMVAGGLRHGGGVDRYACSSTDCGTPSAPSKGTATKGGTAPGGLAGFFGGGSSSSGRPQQSLPWSGLTSKDVDVMGALGCSGAGGGGGSGGSGGEHGGTQGPGGSLGDWGGQQECVAQAISQPRDPYAVYVRCVAAVAVDQRAQTYDLSGVPMGPDCNPGVAAPSGGSTPPSGGSTTTAPSSGSSTTTTAATTDSTSTTAAPPAPCEPTGILDAIQKLFDCGLPVLSKALTGESPSAPSGAGAIVSTEIELLKPDNGEKFYDAAGGVMQHKVDLACADGTLSDEMCAQLATMKPGEQAEFLRRTGHMQDCADPDQCDSGCTSLDSQAMARMQDCEQQLTSTLAPPPAGQNAPGTREHPSPESDPGHLPDDPLLDCLLAGADGARSGIDLGCALVSCAGPSAAAVGAGSACCGAATPTIGVSLARILTERTCETVHCADGQSVVADGLGECGCGDGAPLTGGSPGPQPSPEGPRSPGR